MFHLNGLRVFSIYILLLDKGVWEETEGEKRWIKWTVSFNFASGSKSQQNCNYLSAGIPIYLLCIVSQIDSQRMLVLQRDINGRHYTFLWSSEFMSCFADFSKPVHLNSLRGKSGLPQMCEQDLTFTIHFGSQLFRHSAVATSMGQKS